MELKERVKRGAHALDGFWPARTLLKRGRLLKRLLRLAPSYPLHRAEPIEPFFIVGSGRCGTTLLRRLLMASDEVHIPPENWALGSVILRFRQYRCALDWDEIVRLTVSYFAHQGAGDRWFGPHSVEPLIQELNDVAPEKRSLAYIVDAAYRYQGKVNESSFERWGDKTPLNVNHVNRILDLFPNARFIHLVRDGVDVVGSMLQMEQYSDLQQAALRWKSAIDEVKPFARENPGRYLEVYYEDLVRDPAASVEEACQFLRLDFSPRLIEQRDPQMQRDVAAHRSHYKNVFKPISADHVGKGRRQLSTGQKRQLHRLIGTDLIRAGYDPAV